MCGRYTITVDKSTIERRFGGRFYIAQADYEPTYNAAPSQLLPIMRTYQPDRIELAKWGFVSEDTGPRHVRPQNNARLETAADKPMFAKSFAGQHCMVLADSFYEWKTVGRRKQPYRFLMKSGEPFAMAGIYARVDTDRFEAAEKGPVTFAILTTTANEIMEPIHDRMPVILPLGKEKMWLEPRGGTLLRPFPAQLMTCYPVTAKMNRVSFNEPEAVTPIEPVIQLSF
jgi:putative SOS response-associated peptidase YedK